MTPTTPPPLLRTGKAPAEIMEAAGISDESRAALGAVAPGGLAAALTGLEATMEALAFVAHALPRREAVWWAFTCARTAAGQEPEPQVGACLEAAKAWIAEPTEPNRRAAYQAAEAVGTDTPAGFVGMAAFLSGPTLGPPDGAPIPPEEHAGAKAVMGAVGLAALDHNPDDPGVALKEFLGRGLELAERVQLWTPPPSREPRA